MNLIMRQLLKELKDHIEILCEDSTAVHKSCTVLKSLYDRYAHFKDNTGTTSANSFLLFIIMCSWLLLAVYVIRVWSRRNVTSAYLKHYDVPASRVRWKDEVNESSSDSRDVRTHTEAKSLFGTRCYDDSSETAGQETETYKGESATLYSTDSEISESSDTISESDSSEDSIQVNQGSEESDIDSTIEEPIP